jgi:hypothetical protein
MEETTMVLTNIGFNDTSPENFIIDSGAIYIGATIDSSTGLIVDDGTATKLGATSGGVKVTISKKVRDIEMDGTYLTPLQGLAVYESAAASAECSLKELSPENIALILKDQLDNNIIKGSLLLPNSAYIEGLAIVGRYNGTQERVIFFIDYALPTSDFALELKDKSEATNDVTFSAYNTTANIEANYAGYQVIFPDRLADDTPTDPTP